MKTKKAWVAALIIATAMVLFVTPRVSYALSENDFTHDLGFNSNTAITAGLTKTEINNKLQSAIDIINDKIVDIVESAGEEATPAQQQSALDVAYRNGEIPFYSILGMNGGTFRITKDNRNMGASSNWSRWNDPEYVMMMLHMKNLNDGTGAFDVSTQKWEGRGAQVHFNFKTGEPVFVNSIFHQVLEGNSGRVKLSNAIDNIFGVSIDSVEAETLGGWEAGDYYIQNFVGGYIKYNQKHIGTHEGRVHFHAGAQTVYDKYFDKVNKVELSFGDSDYPVDPAGLVGVTGFDDSRDGLVHPKVKSGTMTQKQIAALFANAYHDAVDGTTYGISYNPGYTAMPARESFGSWGWDMGPGGLGQNFGQRFISGDSITDKPKKGEQKNVTYLIWNTDESINKVFVLRDGFLDYFLDNKDIGVAYSNDFIYEGDRYQNFYTGYVKITGTDRSSGVATYIPGMNISNTGIVTLAPAAVNISIPLSEHNDILSPNGKGSNQILAAFVDKIMLINDGITNALNTGKSLDNAVADGDIPFYSVSNNYILATGMSAFGSAWSNKYVAEQTLIILNTDNGITKEDKSIFQHLNGTHFGFITYNAKTDEAVVVAGEFGVRWQVDNLGMPVADSFTYEGKGYQNFSDGYIVIDEGVATTVRYKNIDPVTGTVIEADANAAGYLGAVTLAEFANPDMNQYKARRPVGLNNNEEIQAFSAAISSYYDSLKSNGINPGYPSFSARYYNNQTVGNFGVVEGVYLYNGDSIASKPEMQNFSFIAYNSTNNTFSLIRDEFMLAIQDNVHDAALTGAPISEVLEINYGELAGRYQVFDNGFIRVNGSRSASDYATRLTVSLAEDTAYVPLPNILTAAIDTFLTDYADTAHSNGAAYYGVGWERFELAYNIALELSGKNEVELTTIYNNLTGAYCELVDQSLLDDINALKTELTQLTNTDKKYTADSWGEFVEAMTQAMAMDEEGKTLIEQKIEALNDSKTLLITTESIYDTLLNEIESIANTDDRYTTLSWATFTAARTNALAMDDETFENQEIKSIAIEAAIALLVERQQMADISITSASTTTLGSDLMLTISGGNGAGEVTFVITGGTGEGTIVEGKLKATKSGTIIIKAIKDGGSDYYTKESSTLTITVSKRTIDKPSTPTAKTITTNSIVMQPVDGAEYRLGVDGEWQDSNIFEGLDKGHEYTIYVRIKETDTAFASESVALTLTTKTNNNLGLVLGVIGGLVGVLAIVGGVVIIKRKKQA